MSTNTNNARHKADDREGLRLIPAEMPPAMQERIAFNLSAEFGANFVEANQRFAKAVYAEAYAAGTALSTGNEEPGRGGALPKIIEASETMTLALALTCEWPDGTETVEVVGSNAARVLGYRYPDEVAPAPPVSPEPDKDEALAEEFDRANPMWLRDAMQSVSPEPDSRAGVERNRQYAEVLRMLRTTAERASGDPYSPLFPDEARLILAAIHSAPTASAAAGPVGEEIGPRTITTSRQTCEGCPALTLKDWKFCGENDETDSGTSAKCAASEGKHICSYWSGLDRIPDWCPVLATPTPALHPGPAMEGR